MQHDVLLRTPLAERARCDAEFEAESISMAKSPPSTEPHQELYAPYTARAMWKVMRAIDWTHMLHEQTYDIMSDADIPWQRKQAYLDRAVRYQDPDGQGLGRRRADRKAPDHQDAAR